MPQPLNYLTARPMLELLLGFHGFEAPQVTPDQAVPALLELFQQPQVAGMVDLGFQVDVIAENPEDGQITIQLGARYPMPLLGFEDDKPYYRAIGIRWDVAITNPDLLAPSALWAADFPSLPAFFDAVRATPEWQLVTSAPSWQCVIFGEDE